MSKFSGKANFDNTVSILDSKVAMNKTKNRAIENQFKKLKTFDSCCFIGKSYFVDKDGTENYLVVQPIHRYFTVIADKKYISEWKSKGLSDKSIRPLATPNNILIH